MADVVRKIEFGTYLSVIFFWKVQGEKIGVAFLGEITYNYRDTEQIESTFTFAFSQLKPQLL